MGVHDLTFAAAGAATLRECWPVFVAGAAVELWLVVRIRRRGRFPRDWVTFAAILAAVLTAALWGEAFLATQAAYQTLTDGSAETRRELRWHVARSWPLLAPLVIVVLALMRRPRHQAVVAGLVAAAGVLASWIVAMWLYTTNHQPAMFQLLVLPAGLGVTAALVGFTSATAIWMAIGRWIWRDGRRRSGAPPTSTQLAVRRSRRT